MTLSKKTQWMSTLHPPSWNWQVRGYWGRRPWPFLLSRTYPICCSQWCLRRPSLMVILRSWRPWYPCGPSHTFFRNDDKEPDPRYIEGCSSGNKYTDFKSGAFQVGRIIWGWRKVLWVIAWATREREYLSNGGSKASDLQFFLHPIVSIVLFWMKRFWEV